jgi:hypothetical protein
MKKKVKRLLLASGAALVSLLILLLVSFSVFYFRKSLTKGILEKWIVDKTGAKVEIGKLDYGLFPFRAQFNSLNVFQKIEETEIEISLERLTVNGSVKRLLKKQKPLFQSIEIEGGKGRVKVSKVGKKVDYRKNIIMFFKALNSLGRLSLKDFALELVYLSNSISFEKGSLEFSPGDKEGEWIFSLSGENSLVRSLAKEISLETSFQARGKLSFLGVPRFEGDLLFSPLYIHFLGKDIFLPETAFNFRSEFLMDENVLSLPQFEARILPLLVASGSMKVDLERDYSFSVLSKVHLKDFSKIHDFLKPYPSSYLPPQVKDLTLNGSASLEGEFQNIKSSSGQEMSFKGLMRLDPTQIRCSAFGFSFQDIISGELRAEGSNSGMKFSGLIKSKQGRFSGKEIEAQDFSLELPFQGTSSSFAISRFKFSIKELALSLAGKRIEFPRLELGGGINCDLEKRKIDVSRLELRLPSFPPLQLEAEVDLKARGKKYFQLKSSEIDIISLSSLLSSFLPLKIADWEPSGRFSLLFEAESSIKNSEEYDLRAELDLSQGAFHNPPFTIAAESLHPKISLKGKYSPSLQSIPFSLAIDLSQGESLYNKYYLSWSKSPLLIKGSGVFHLPQRRIDELVLEASLSSLGAVTARGQLKIQEPMLFDLSLSSSSLSLQSLMSLISQQQMMENPALELKGEAEVQATLKKEGQKLQLAAELQLKNGSIENKGKGFFMEKMEARIPVYFESGSKENEDQKEAFSEKGYFSAENLKTSLFSISPLRLDFDVGKNTFIIKPFSAQVFGGKETLGETVFRLDTGPFGIHGLSSLTLSEVDISKFPLKSSQFRLSGKIRAGLNRVEINSEEINTQGALEVNIFDGKVTVKNIKITKPFSKNRTISCDALLEDLSLERFTDTVPFGRVTGFIRGEVKDLALSYGQPESFTLGLESVKKKGVSQKFSLGAVNSLSILSSGEGTAVPVKSGLTRFVSEFGYEKMGIFCSLKNDIFTLRGTIQERGVEYLVKRSWLFGISVVNKKPRNRISFKDMVSRLKRIGRSQQAK